MTRGTDISEAKRMYRTPVLGTFPPILTPSLKKETDLKYGENPNQAAAIYRNTGSDLAELTNISLVKSGKGGISATNYMDVTRALEILKYFQRNAAVVMKHTIPSGFTFEFVVSSSASNQSQAEIYRKARDADRRSAFGSVVVFNKLVDKECAEALIETFVEGVAAPRYNEGAMEVFETKRDLRVISYSNLDRLPRFIGDDTRGLHSLISLPTGRVLVQEPYLTSIRGPENLIFDAKVKDSVVQRDPTYREIEDLLTAWYLNFGVRSNGIVLVKNGVTLAVGGGQQERVGAVEQAITKAFQKAMDQEEIEYDPFDWFKSINLLSSNPLDGAVCSSDGFFPKKDSIERLGRFNVSAIIHPAGSINDAEIIQAANEHNMVMAVTLERCFGHF